MRVCEGVCSRRGDEWGVFAVPVLLSGTGVIFGLLAARVSVSVNVCVRGARVRVIVAVLQHVVILQTVHVRQKHLRRLDGVHFRPIEIQLLVWARPRRKARVGGDDRRGERPRGEGERRAGGEGGVVAHARAALVQLLSARVCVSQGVRERVCGQAGEKREVLGVGPHEGEGLQVVARAPVLRRRRRLCVVGRRQGGRGRCGLVAVEKRPLAWRQELGGPKQQVDALGTILVAPFLAATAVIRVTGLRPRLGGVCVRVRVRI